MLHKEVFMDAQNLRKFHARHYFHSVGHGLFYSFEIADHETKKTELLFVYDCGTNSQKHFLRSEIKSFENRHGEKNPIDVLVLSRLDYNHFLGLMSLLEGRESGDMVIIPHLTDVEKTYHLILHNQIQDAEYLEFIQNPKIFMNKFFKKIILVSKAERPMMFNPSSVFPAQEKFELVSSTTDQAMIDDNSYLRTNLGWIFYFYLSTPEQPILKQIEEEFYSLGFSQKSIEDNLHNSVTIEKMKEIFSRHQWTEHESNLVCVHGPSSNKHCSPTGFWYARRSFHFLEHHLANKKWRSLGGKEFCVLTGSMNLFKNWGSLRDKLQKISERISIFTIPHHGEREHWNDAIVRDVDPDAWVVSSRLWSLLVSNHKVLAALKHETRGGEICHVHEFRNMAIERIFILKDLKET